ELPRGFGLDAATLARLETLAPGWADEIAAWLAARDFAVVGATSTFEQTNASLALLGRLKRLRPDVVTLLGGANCDGPMAEGVTSIDSPLDYVFSGESEASFPAFLRALGGGERPAGRVVQGAPCRDL